LSVSFLNKKLKLLALLHSLWWASVHLAHWKLPSFN
jgi:hypothetical protein